MTLDRNDVMGALREAQMRGELPTYTEEELRRQRRIETAILAAVALVALVCVVAQIVKLPTRSRAAYNEGFYGVDRATAVAMAEAGLGKTAEEVTK